jgi:syntaxin 18
MNIISQFNDCLATAGSPPIQPFVFNLQAINEFLQEAYRIHSHISELTAYLRTIRSPYLSLQSQRLATHRAKHSALQDANLPKGDKSQPLTDVQRERVDTETRQLLTTISGAVRQLSETAQISLDLDESVARQKRSRGGLGALGRWAAGGGATSKSQEEIEEDSKRETLKKHRDGVVWYLQRRLESAAEMQRDMMEKRLTRDIERSKSVLYKARGPETMGLIDGIGVSNGTTNTLSAVELDTEEQSAMKREAMEAMLSPEQIQLFEQEQQDMLRHYNSELNKIKYVVTSFLPSHSGHIH